MRIGLGFPVTIVAVPLLVFWDRFERDPWLMAWWLALVTVSVLVHEGGHVVALRGYGFHPRVSLNALGGLTSTDETGHLSPGRSMVVSLAGPLTGIAFGITLHAGLVPIDGPTITWLRDASWLVNIGWSLINLLPIMPLDGGHVMRELVELASRRRGAAVAWLVTLMVALSVGAWLAWGDRHPVGVALAIVLMVATNVRFFAVTERQRRVQSIDVAHEQLMDGDLDPAVATLLPIAWSADGKLIGDGAYTTLAWALVHERRFAELATLDPSRFHPHHRPLLVGAVAWYRGDVQSAVVTVAGALARGPVDPPDTYFARVFGRLGEIDRLTQHIATMSHGDAVAAGVRLHRGVESAAVAA